MAKSVPYAATRVLVFGLTCLPGVALSQNERWVYAYSDSGSYVNCVVCDVACNTYSAGSRYGSNGDFFVVSTDSDGRERWTYRYNGSANMWDYANAIAYDGHGRVYAAGTSNGQGTSVDFTIVALDTAGTQQWVYRYNGRVNSWDEAYCVTCGADGNIYAAGVCDSNNQVLVLSLTPTGTRRWMYRYGGPGKIDNCGRAIACGPDGNVYVAGFGVGEGTWKDFTVISLTSTGQQRWVYTRNGSAHWSADDAWALACDSAGNVYAAGWCEDSITGEDVVIVSLDPTGHERWVYRLEGPAGLDDEALSLALDANGSVYAAGFAGETASTTDLIVASVTSSGQHRWTYRYGGAPHFNEAASWIAVGPTGDLYVAGKTCPARLLADFTIVSLSAAGSERWVYYYDGPAHNSDAANCVTVGNDGCVYAAGKRVATYGDAVVVSLTAGTGIEKEGQRGSASSAGVLRCWPDPFAGNATIEYSLPHASSVELVIYTTSGRLVRVLAGGRKSAGTYTTRWNGTDESGRNTRPGIYICCLKFGHGSVSTAKLLRTR